MEAITMAYAAALPHKEISDLIAQCTNHCIPHLVGCCLRIECNRAHQTEIAGALKSLFKLTITTIPPHLNMHVDARRILKRIQTDDNPILDMHHYMDQLNRRGLVTYQKLKAAVFLRLILIENTQQHLH